MALLPLIIYTRVRIVRPFVCANCVRVYTIERTYARAYIYTYTHALVSTWVCVWLHAKTQFLTCVCVRMRACLRADLIKMQNAFARKIFQHSNALWVQKLSGCTICTSLLCSIKKVLERLIYNKLCTFVLNKITPDQFDFMPKHSCLQQFLFFMQ